MGFPQELLDNFVEWVNISIDDKGVYPFPAAYVIEDDKLAICSLALPPDLCYDMFWSTICKGKCSAIIMGIDRYTKPNQGTEFADVLSVYCWWDDPEIKWQDSYKVGVINYQNEPRIVRPIDWDNAHWNRHMISELQKFRPLFRVAFQNSAQPS